jgi:hypothetical protein
MPITTRRLRRLARAVLPALALAAACENSVSIQPDVLAGNYSATSFLVTTAGQPPVDVLAKGGSLTINIAADNTITGLLSLPAGVLSAQGGTADMAGEAIRLADGNVRFNQAAASFVSALTWQQFTDALVTTSFLSNTQFQITLRK